MTLDNCIKRYEIWASDDRISPDIREEHKQIAKWLNNYKKMLEQEPCEDCRNCNKWSECECGEVGHKNGTSIGYSIGNCKEYEPCDCISREQAFKCFTWTNTKDDVYYGIKALPPVTPKPKTEWIPVSERLPENHDDVLVWFEYIKDDYDCAWWGLAYYSQQYKKWVVSTNERNPIVKAWMPLPKPYKAESEE